MSDDELSTKRARYEELEREYRAAKAAFKKVEAAQDPRESTRARPPDCQRFDAVTIETVPRFKTGPGGNEWRISAVLRFWRKGKVYAETRFDRVATAIEFAHAQYLDLVDDLTVNTCVAHEHQCDQEGCAEDATVTYALKTIRHCVPCSRDEPVPVARPMHRRFCVTHSIRGDHSLDDDDDNYVLIAGEPAERVADERPATVVAVTHAT